MEIKQTVRSIHTCDDLGVELGHISRDFKQILTKQTLHRHPIAKLPNEYQVDSLQFHPLSRELIIPNKYDSLLSSVDSESMRKELKLYYHSEVNIHERQHDKIRREHRHVYIGQYFNSYLVPLFALHRQDRQGWEYLAKMAEDTAKSLREWELLHEGRATTSQLNFLKDHNRGQLTVDVINLKEEVHNCLESGNSIETYLETRESPELTENGAHAIGHYLYERAQEIWDIDVYATSHQLFQYTKNENSGTSRPNAFAPDDVLLFCGAIVDAEEVSECTPAQQLELLTERINKWAKSNFSFQKNKEGQYLGRTESIESDFTIKEPREIEREYRRMNVEHAIDHELYHWIPIVSTRYPEPWNTRTLWRILENIYAITTQANERLLFIDEDTYQWAEGTKLLELGITLWRLRDLLFIPLVNAHRRSVPYNTLSLMKSISERDIKSSVRRFDREATMEHILQSIDEMGIENIPFSEYESVIKDLEGLGKAILSKNKSKIRRYY